MKTCLVVVLIVLAVGFVQVVNPPIFQPINILSGQGVTAAVSGKDVDQAVRQKVMNLYGKLPLTFVENKGQFDSQVRF